MLCIVDLAITKNQYGRSCHGRARSEGLYTPIGWGHINCCLRPNRAGVPDFVYRIDGQLCLCLFSFQRSMQRGLFWFFFARMFLLCIQWIKKCGEAHEGLIVDFLIVYHTFRFLGGWWQFRFIFFIKMLKWNNFIRYYRPRERKKIEYGSLYGLFLFWNVKRWLTS